MQNKVLTIYSDEKLSGETEFFFNGDDVVTAIDGNDGNYRDEYMNCLFESFGITAKRVKRLNSKQRINFLEYCTKHGIEIAEKEDVACDNNFGYHVVKLISPYGYQDLLFYIPKDAKYAKNFITMYQKRMKKEKEYDEGTSLYYFKELTSKALDATKLSHNNDLTVDGSTGALSSANLLTNFF